MVTSYLALDVGEARIGVSVANNIARIAAPLGALPNDAELVPGLKSLIAQNDVSTIVVGLPRGLDGQSTAQTEYVEAFVAKLQPQIDLPFHFQDEALTSVRAEGELTARKRVFEKGEVDSLSAVYILEDFLLSEVH